MGRLQLIARKGLRKMDIARLIADAPLSLHLPSAPPSAAQESASHPSSVPLPATTTSPWSFTGPGLLDTISYFNLNIVSHTILLKINLNNLLTLSDTVEVRLHKDLSKKILIQG